MGARRRRGHVGWRTEPRKLTARKDSGAVTADIRPGPKRQHEGTGRQHHDHHAHEPRLIVSMMEAGWEPADADNALKAVPAWAQAPCRAVDEHSRANAREWDHVTERGPVHKVWQFRASIARSWAEYREHAARA